MTEPTLLVVTEYLIGGAQRCQPWALSIILQALGAVVYENIGNLTKVGIAYQMFQLHIKKQVMKD